MKGSRHSLPKDMVSCESINWDSEVPIEENIMDDLSKIMVYKIEPKKGKLLERDKELW